MLEGKRVGYRVAAKGWSNRVEIRASPLLAPIIMSTSLSVHFFPQTKTTTLIIFISVCNTILQTQMINVNYPTNVTTLNIILHTT